MVALEVFLGEFALCEGRIGSLREEFLKFLNREVGVDVEVCFGVLHIAFGVVFLEGDGHFVFAGGSAPVLLRGGHVAFEDVDGGFLVLGILVGLGEVFFDFFRVGDGVGVVVCAGYVDGDFVVFLAEFLSCLEVVFGGVFVAGHEFECSKSHVVVGAFGVGGHAEVEVFLGSVLVALGEFGLAEVVVGSCFVGGGVAYGAVEDGLGVVVLAGLVVLDAVLVALTLCARGDGACGKHGNEKFEFHLTFRCRINGFIIVFLLFNLVHSSSPSCTTCMRVRAGSMPVFMIIFWPVSPVTKL